MKKAITHRKTYRIIIISIGMLFLTFSAFSQLTGNVSNLNDVACFGEETGSVTISGSGGTEPYEYKIDGGEYQSSGTFENLPVGSYVFIVKDDNDDTATVSVTISEPEALIVEVASQQNVECPGFETGAVGISVSGGTTPYTYTWSTDNGIGLEPAEEDQTGLGAGLYILIVTDANGCTADLSVTITESPDTEIPVITGGEDGSTECTGSDPSQNADYIAWRDGFAGIAATDNCGVESITYDEDNWYSGDCADEITVVIAVTDDSGNTATVTFDYRIADTTPPDLSGGADGSAESTGSDPGDNQAYIDWRDSFAGITSTDLCGATTMRYDEGTWESTDEEDKITVHFIAVDECELIAVKQHTFTIAKTGGPIITCPADLSVECLSDVPAPDISEVTAVGNGVVVSHVGDVTDGNSCPEIITRTYRATDEDDNFVQCSQAIIIHDITPPTISCPGPAFIESINDLPEVDINAVTATDNCTQDPIITFVSDDSGISNCSEIVTRTYMATDDCGNTTTCTQLIIINDIVPPSLICPESLELSCMSQLQEANPAEVVSVDNCGPVTVSHVEDISDGNTCPEIIFRVFQAIDESGNIAECAQQITINDTIPPVLIGVPEDTVVNCNDIPEPAEVLTADNCGLEDLLVLEYKEIANSVENCEGAIVRQWIATDACGNTVMDFQTIIVESATGIEEKSLDENIIIYPNPSDGLINISGLIKPAKVEIYSTTGVLIWSENQVNTGINISGLKTGTYFLRISLENGQVIRRSVVKM